MKKYNKYLYALLSAIILIGCSDPLEDEVNKAQEDLAVIEKAIVVTLTDDDYDIVDKGYGNFNSEDEAKELIPTILDTNYPALGDGSSATVTYNIYAPRTSQKVQFIYEVSGQDYADQGHTYGNFDSFDDITEFLDWKYPSLESYEDEPQSFTSPSNGDFVFLEYLYHIGGGVTINLVDGFVYNDGAWEQASGFTEDEYSSMGEPYANFSDEDEAMAKIPIFLSQNYVYDPQAEGTIEAVSYGIYDDGTVYGTLVYFILSGNEWIEYTNEVQQVLKLGNKEDVWVPDNTIKHTLSNDDYISIGAIEGGDRGTNIAQYFSFYQGSNTSGGTYWPEEEIDPVLIELLNKDYANHDDGQKYLLSCDVYKGSGVYQVRSSKFIKESGAYILLEE